MGIQKRRRSKMSGATRRAHWKLARITLVACPNCHAQMRPHRACPTCGQYAGREVIKIEKPDTK
ncbi:MAG TPA: 50S ribosomal protein L32 [bacterium]|jgi:large subunit ribosomal protein L32|nr:50S ribosomal protein L32 [bacterium]